MTLNNRITSHQKSVLSEDHLCPWSTAGLRPWLTDTPEGPLYYCSTTIPSLSAVLNLLIPFPLAFSFCSSSLWDLVRLTGVHPSDRSSSAVAGHCSACRQQLRRCPAWSKDREFRAVAEMRKRCLFFNFPVLSCSARVSGQLFSSKAWQTASDSCCGHAQVMAPNRFSPDGFYLHSLLAADAAGNAGLYLALYHFIPWYRLSAPFLLQSLSLLSQASSTFKAWDLKADHTVTQWCHALSYHRSQVTEQPLFTSI